MQKILIANRGEIAVRIIKSARKMGIKTVAVYSEADRNAPHVQLADEAIFIGPSQAAQSYLRKDKILEAARVTGADAIHPGYGFLSENADFAREVEQSGIIFIGPTPESMEIMGSKIAAKDAAKAHHIPLVPGADIAIDKIDYALAEAEKIGYPVLIKASAGGGGKGMRTVTDAADLAEQIQRAISEATSAFGDGTVFMEKYVTGPRHIEIQVLADQHGNVLYLFERECSIQRRHQKVVEEAPSSVLTPELRHEMGMCAVRVSKACGYRGAGTVEFLLDAFGNFYFLEMNTRLQVEHPVTELITGIDLVEEQIRVARGEKLRFGQEDLNINGHALELRVYAEDPFDGFLPSIGKLEVYELPELENVRVDHGYRQGMDIPIYYDPMIAKLIVWGEDRIQAIELMKKAIARYHIEGPATTLPFGTFVMNHEAFVSGNFDTGFVSKYYSKEAIFAMNEAESKVAAQIGVWIYERERKKLRAIKH